MNSKTNFRIFEPKLNHSVQHFLLHSYKVKNFSSNNTLISVLNWIFQWMTLFDVLYRYLFIERQSLLKESWKPDMSFWRTRLQIILRRNDSNIFHNLFSIFYIRLILFECLSTVRESLKIYHANFSALKMIAIWLISPIERKGRINVEPILYTLLTIEKSSQSLSSEKWAKTQRKMAFLSNQ